MSDATKKSTFAVKGHLATKSSALSATGSCKLEAQFITAQNMASHYKRVINAKSSINTLPPKSMIQSQKARDRIKRELLNFSHLANSLQPVKSSDSFINKKSSIDDQSDKKMETVSQRACKSAREPAEEDIKLKALKDRERLHRSMSNLMNNFTLNSTKRVNLYKQSSNHELLETKSLKDNLVFNSHNNENKALIHPALKAMTRLSSSRTYDVLENHADQFKHPVKQFSPRIKNMNSSSSLSKNTNFYQAPRRKLRKTVSSIEVPKERSSSIEIEDEQDQLSMNEFENTNNISTSREIIPLEKSDKLAKLENKSLFQRSFKKNESKEENASKTEEQLRYLEFVKDVTHDIKSRGVTSERVINNCFENHIKKRKNSLNENKMRELLVTLRRDIGLPEENDQSKDILHETNNLNTSTGSEYLILEKIGWSGEKNAEQIIQKEKDKPLVKNSTSSNSLINDELENKENSYQLRKQSTESRKSSSSSNGSTKGSILKKKMVKSDSIESEKVEKVDDDDDEEEDDDDDIFSSDYTKIKNESKSLVENSQDIVFDDDYGDGDEDDFNK